MTSTRSLFSWLMLLSGLAVVAGCGRSTIESRWRDREITIDGRDAEWQNARVMLEDASVGMGLMNDDEYLYLTLSMMDRAIQAQIMRQGFIVWFDSRGGKKKRFGIRFPLGMQEMAMAGKGERPQGMGMGGMGRDGTPTAEQLKAMFERLVWAPEMEILGPGKNQQQRVGFAGSEEIQLEMGYENGRMVYELRVPFATNPHGIGADAKLTIGLGFETPELDMAALRQRMGGRGGGMPGGGMGGGMRGGRMGGMRGMRGVRGGRRPEPFQLWIKVRRASE